MALQETKLTINGASFEAQVPTTPDDELDYSKRAQWLRAAVLGANDGLVSTASLIMGVGAVRDGGARAMLVAGFAGLVAGACSMAIGEFVSVYSQLDTEIAQLNRAEGRKDATVGQAAVGDMRQLPSPVQAAVASALAFSVGGAVPLLAAGFITSYKVRMMVVAAAVTVALLGFGIAGAVLGRAPVGRSCVRVVVGGWLAMAITFGLMKLFASTGL
ncbi:vacuolar iron transporter homolog 4-like [Ananas comosus]|uniref:Vacuolar iron transporter n=1 Tax=Ananas comosus TaxID=4615 RepID=A0A199V6J6_ANACO|nr:vacuolar iron transporter homolog 4-like [Ananas comosus]OAY72689.1 Vacuolar iron transporter [Ananas comosus]